MTAMAFDPKTLASTWNSFQRALPVRLAAFHTQADHERAVEFMNQLLDVVGDAAARDWRSWSRMEAALFGCCCFCLAAATTATLEWRSVSFSLGESKISSGVGGGSCRLARRR